MTCPVKLLLFDCDGTLADSQHLIAESMHRAFVDAGVAPPSRTMILRTVGLSIPQAIAALFPDGCEPTMAELAAGYRRWNAQLRFEPGMQEPMFKGASRLLHDLAVSGNVVLGIATGKSRRGLLRFVETNGLSKLFATLQSADDAPSKPHPAMVLQAMAETGALAQDTVMIGDTHYDMAMARHAGIKGIGVSWGHHRSEELLAAGAVAVAKSFADLRVLLQPAVDLSEAVKAA